MKSLYIIGAGGFSKQVVEIVELLNEESPQYDLVGLVDDDPSKWGHRHLGYRVLGGVDYLSKLSKAKKIYGVIAIAKREVRMAMEERLASVNWVNLIHPRTIISKYITMGQGNIICGGAILNPHCRIGSHCHINIGSNLGHDAYLEDHITVMPGSNLSGAVTLRRGVAIGSGAVILQKVEIGSNTTIGAGAVVLEDAQANSVYVGVPARRIR